MIYCSQRRIRTCRENSLQFKFVNNFNKKLHFKICHGVLNLLRVFFRFAFFVDHFLLLPFLNINGMSSITSVWQQWYHNNVCHVVWMFRLTLGRSFHFFLVLLLLALNIICLLWILPNDTSLWKTKKKLYLLE